MSENINIKTYENIILLLVLCLSQVEFSVEGKSKERLRSKYWETYFYPDEMK
jgi:hypothetical protein